MNFNSKKIDYHMHPNIINKPDNADLFINHAIEMGFDEICFTDHMPLSICNAADRIPKGEVEKYCELVREKAAEYKDHIVIKTGIEIDYHPDFIDEIESVLCAGQFDYIVGASHLHIPGYNIDMSKLTYNDFARISFETSLCAINSGYFDAIAHLDLFRWVFTLPKRFPLIADEPFDLDKHKPILKEIMKALEVKKMMLEINSIAILHNVSNNGMYPEKEIINLSYGYDLKYIFGSDAHSFDRIGEGFNEMQLSQEYGEAMNKIHIPE